MSGSSKLRLRFTILTFLVAIALLAWGAFVTSINAGLAVPDWPTSFNSYDPFNPWPQWWNITPVFAEHGHRLLGALVGLFTVGLAFLTWRSDDRKWMVRLAFGAVALVIIQGVLGGLRVIWVSLDLAVVHTLVAELFFALLASMAIFVSDVWKNAENEHVEFSQARGLGSLLWLAPATVFVQIALGALLRHPGAGIDILLASLHFGWAFMATIMVVVLWTRVRDVFAKSNVVTRAAHAMLMILLVQVMLGLFAYFVLLDESGAIQPSNVQVIANTAHMVVGALLFASTVTVGVLCGRIRAATSLSQ